VKVQPPIGIQVNPPLWIKTSKL